MPNPESQPRIQPISELKHSLTEAQTDYLEKLNKQLLELTGGKALEQLKLDGYSVEIQEKILELGEMIEKVARGEIKEEPWDRERVIVWAKEQVGKDREWVDETFNFSDLPKIKVEEGLNLHSCANLESLPDNLEVGGNLWLSGCTNLESLPDNLKVGGNLDLADCTNLESLPDNLEVRRGLDLNGCSNLKSLPDNLEVGRNLYLHSCTKLKFLPDNLEVEGDLFLNNCANLESLPDNLKVEGDLDLGGCTKLKSLPDNLEVGGGLWLMGCKREVVEKAYELKKQGNIKLQITS